MRTFPSASLCPIEADRFALVWTDPDERKAVTVCLWLWGELVYFDTWEVTGSHAWIEEWTPEPFGILIEDLPWWLEKRLRYEIARA